MLKYFGTDGIRGKVGTDPITPEFCVLLGRALGRFLKQYNRAKPVTVALGRDSRASGAQLQSCLQEGLQHHNILTYSLGMVPSPAVSKAVRDLSADLGIMVTASHNPASDNGIKLFNNRGLKFSVETEEEIERYIESEEPSFEVRESANEYCHEGAGHYINYLRSLMHQGCLSDWTIALDMANGATVEASPAVLGHFGARLIRLADAPDGSNINDGVGSEHPEELARQVVKNGARLGIAHDGDGDRTVVCDETGSIVTGEELLGILALDALKRKALKGNTLVTTVQSNMGLDKAIQQAGGRVERVGVGDRNIVIRMQERGYNLGGESSGHVVFFDHSVTGDGLLTAVKIIDVMMRSKKPLSELRKAVSLFPQITQNVRVTEKRPSEDCVALQETIREIEGEMNGSGRLLVRYSGTESKLRLLVEGEDRKMLTSAMDRLVAAAAEDLELVDSV